MLEKRKIYLCLIVSGCLNLVLFALCVYLTFVETGEYTEPTCHTSSVEHIGETNADIIARFSLLPYTELVSNLQSKELMEYGYTKRDLALAALVSFHHFNIEKALAGAVTERCLFKTENSECVLFPFLEDRHYAQILQFIAEERWPFTSEGLFLRIKKQLPGFDPSLLAAFSITPEVQKIALLFDRSGAPLHMNMLLSLIMEGEYAFLNGVEEGIEGRRIFLLRYLRSGSRFSAKIFIEIDRDYVLRRFSNEDIGKLMDLIVVDEAFKEALLRSPRSIDAPRKEFTVMQEVKERVHIIENGENLWKIARKYHTTVHRLMEYNQLETERIRPGRTLKIPQ